MEDLKKEEPEVEIIDPASEEDDQTGVEVDLENILLGLLQGELPRV